jgi:hypothetical protein
MHHKVAAMSAEPTKPPGSRTAKKIWEGTLTTNHQDMAGNLYDGLKALADGEENYKKPSAKRMKNAAATQILGTKDAFLRLAAERYAAQAVCDGKHSVQVNWA